MHMNAAGHVARGETKQNNLKVLTTMKDFIILSKIGKYSTDLPTKKSAKFELNCV